MDAHTQQRSFWDKFWRDDSGKVVVYQRPNLPIVVWFVASLVCKFAFKTHTTGWRVTFGIATASLVIWALLELFRGVNYFRRSLGLVVLLALAVRLILR